MRIFSIAALTALALMAFTYGSAPLDMDAKSSITWTGAKVTGKHTGTVDFKSSDFSFDKAGALTGASFEVDMKTIKCTDLDEGTGAKLVGHLNSADFFDVENHPVATFNSSEVKSLGKGFYSIQGDLTIKGITRPLEVQANVERIGEEVLATAKVEVDRTKYDIKYGSGSFFKGLGDKMIDDTFALDIIVRK